jgi:predicted nucleotidyltransferase
MQKVSTDKLIKKQLEEEAGESLKENLKKSILSPSERKAAQETAKNIMEKRFIQTARAEVFKSAEYPEFIGSEGTKEERQINKRLLKAMEKVAKELESKLGDKFIAVSLFGSHAKGYASKSSDADVRIFVEHADPNQEQGLRSMARGIIGEVGCGIHVESIEALESAKGYIHLVKEGRTYGLFGRNEESAWHVMTFFDGKFFGGRIEEARKEIMSELAKSHYGEQIWEKIREIQNYYGYRSKLGVTGEDFREILEARKEFVLPTFEKMKKRYGVA